MCDSKFLKLPSDILTMILSYIDWKSLVTIRTICRELHLHIEKNIRHMQKPRLYKFLMMDVPDNSQRFYLYYSFFGVPGPDPYTFRIFDKKFATVEEVLKHMKRFDFKLLQKVFLESKGGTEIFDMFSAHFIYGTSLNTMEINVINCQGDYTKIMNVVRKVNHVEIMKINLSASIKKLPFQVAIPTSNSLRRIYLYERNKLTFITREMIITLIEKNPSLRTFYIDSKRETLYGEILNILVKRQIDNKSYGCEHVDYEVFFKNVSTTASFLVFPRIFAKYRYHFRERTVANMNYTFAVGTTSCIKCATSDIIIVYYIS